jgi:DNA-directed RNA polymerase subunit M/transcription elongation factor TFIIS
MYATEAKGILDSLRKESPRVRYEAWGFVYKNGREKWDAFLKFKEPKTSLEDYIVFNQSVFSKAKLFAAKERNAILAITEVVEGVYQCPYCGCRRIFVNVVQTRSADEGPSTKLRCADNPTEHTFGYG